jgi:hypothetical protein
MRIYFLSFFSKIKGVKGDLGEMKIEINPDFKSVKHRSYFMNPRFKEKVKKEIGRMLATTLILPMDEAEWISAILIQRKKVTNDIRFCVNYRSLNSACLHYPFPTPFSDEFLDQVVGNEAYSFTDVFSGYH